MRVTVVGVAFVLVAGCRGGHASDTAAARADPSAATGLAQRLAGCYLIQSANSAPYPLQLTSDGQAHLLDQPTMVNSAGDQFCLPRPRDETVLAVSLRTLGTTDSP